jgi:hypothetical protein
MFDLVLSIVLSILIGLIYFALWHLGEGGVIYYLIIWLAVKLLLGEG